MPAVFISYRREDSSGYAGRLFDIFCTHFGRKNTFMDLDAIHGGDNFAAVIEEKICVTDALVAVIGSHWLTVADDKGNRRLNNPADFVRLEIGKALRRGIRVIPILVGGATIPHPADLPEDLQPLCQRQAVEIRDAHFHQDVEQLIDVLHNAPRSAGFWREKFGSRRIAWLLLPGLIAVVVVLAVLFFRRSTAIPTTPTLSTNVQTNDPTKSKAPVDISGN